jgi:hypothetical protein
MSGTNVTEAFVAKVVAAAGTVPVVHFDDFEQHLSQSNALFIVVEDALMYEQLTGFGVPSAARFNELGSVSVFVFVPASMALADGRTFAESLRDALRHTILSTSPDYITTGASDPPSPALPYNGNWRSLEVRTAVRREFFRSVA